MNGLPTSVRVASLMIPLSLLASAAGAQVAPPTREEIQRVPTGPSATGPARLQVQGGIEAAPCPLAEPRFQAVTVTIQGAQFDNLKGVAPEILRPAYADFVGKTVSIAAVCEIRDAASAILRREGFLASVQVPPQRIENGIVRFDVLMAKLVSVQVRGDAGKSEKVIAGYLNKLTQDEVFNEKTAERYLLLARDLPGYDVRLTMRPAGTVPGEVIGEVTVVRVPFSIDANIQNYGSKDVGRFGALVRGEFYDVLGFGDRLTVGGYNTFQTSEQNVVQAAYDMRAGSEGLTIGGRFTYAWTKPDLGAAANGEVLSRTLLAGLEAGYPFLRSQAATVRGAFGFELLNQKVFFNDIPLTRDRSRVLYGRVDFETVDRGSLASTEGFSIYEPKWRLAGSLEVRKGIGIFDASSDCGAAPLFAACSGGGAVSLSRIEADPRAALVRFSGVAEYRPSPRLAFSLSPRAQYSSRPLISYEEFSAGNYTVGRGYDAGTIIGDKGLGFQAEVRVGTLRPKARDAFSLQPYAFLDQAWVWNNANASPLLRERQSLTSAGGGVRIAYGDHARLDLTVAEPLKRTGLLNRRGGTRFLLSLTTKLYPW